MPVTAKRLGDLQAFQPRNGEYAYFRNDAVLVEVRCVLDNGDLRVHNVCAPDEDREFTIHPDELANWTVVDRGS